MILLSKEMQFITISKWAEQFIVFLPTHILVEIIRKDFTFLLFIFLNKRINLFAETKHGQLQLHYKFFFVCVFCEQRAIRGRTFQL